jgi:hypothetical protein
VPIATEDGVYEAIVGGGVKLKPARLAVPPAVVTDTVPLVPEPTVAVILVGESTVNELATVPPKLTAVAPLKLVPVIITCVPEAAEDGVNEVIVDAEIKLKPARFAVPPEVVTETFPLVPKPTVAVILVEEFTVNELAAVPPKLTAVAPLKLVPLIVTWVPEAAEVDVNEDIVGAGIKVKPARFAVPPAVVTDRFPLVPAPTVTVILVGELTVNEVAAVPPKLTEVAHPDLFRL